MVYWPIILSTWMNLGMGAFLVTCCIYDYKINNKIVTMKELTLTWNDSDMYKMLFILALGGPLWIPLMFWFYTEEKRQFVEARKNRLKRMPKQKFMNFSAGV